MSEPASNLEAQFAATQTASSHALTPGNIGMTTNRISMSNAGSKKQNRSSKDPEKTLIEKDSANTEWSKNLGILTTLVDEEKLSEDETASRYYQKAN